MVYILTFFLIISSIKYAPRIMKEWPAHLQNILTDSKKHANLKSDKIPMEPYEPLVYYSKRELQLMSDWPFWRVKLAKFKCILEMKDGSRYIFDMIFY